MNLIVFDDHQRDHFLPLVWAIPLGQLRWGISTIGEKWSQVAHSPASFLTVSYLHEDVPIDEENDSLYVNARYYPTKGLIQRARALTSNQAIYNGKNLVALRTREQLDILTLATYSFEKVEMNEQDVFCLETITDLFTKNGQAISLDIDLMKIEHGTIPDCKTIGDHTRIYTGENVTVNALSINVTDGPIYIGDNVEVMEGSMLRGPLAICESSTIKMGAKIYGGTTIGPHCKVGGEVSNSNIQGYSNKGHDGFMGNSLIGSWCNLGADTNTSNLKNNYSNVRIYDYATKRYEDSGLTFCGLVMGDHSKSAINTQFNTGSVVGMHSNIFGAGFPNKFIPDFSWGVDGERFDFDKACEVARKVMARRRVELTDEQCQIYRHINDMCAAIDA
jgi:UDP-N-acetylglucosamine diphosphorylase/glucosamine-1-phosphate N-acetyltransferase